MAIDPSKKDHYAKLFAEHGLYLSVSGATRSASWQLMNAAKTWSLSTGFDIDLDRAYVQLQQGRKPHEIDLTFHAAPVVKSTGNGATLTGGPFCVMCGEPATLFCPNLVKRAELLSVRLFFPVGDARLSPARLHPGRCRKRLGQLLQTAQDALKTVSRQGT